MVNNYNPIRIPWHLYFFPGNVASTWIHHSSRHRHRACEDTNVPASASLILVGFDQLESGILVGS